MQVVDEIVSSINKNGFVATMEKFEFPNEYGIVLEIKIVEKVSLRNYFGIQIIPKIIMGNHHRGSNIIESLHSKFLAFAL